MRLCNRREMDLAARRDVETDALRVAARWKWCASLGLRSSFELRSGMWEKAVVRLQPIGIWTGINRATIEQMNAPPLEGVLGDPRRSRIAGRIDEVADHRQQRNPFPPDKEPQDPPVHPSK